jgi:hypothetical protein
VDEFAPVEDQGAQTAAPVPRAIARHSNCRPRGSALHAASAR